MHHDRPVPERVSVARHLATEADTLALGAKLAGQLAPGLIVFLRGDLGAGKTTLVRGLLRALGLRGRVKSPTYTLAELYNVSNLCLYHFDFYRLDKPSDWRDAGFRESFSGPCVCLVEWPERAAGTLPEADLEIDLALEGEGRAATLTARSDAGERCLKALAR